MIISIGAHALLLLLFVFLLAWKAPDPPLPEYGIEINFGVSEVGTGDIQPETAPVESEAEEEAAPEESSEEVVEEVLEETPVEETTQPVTEPVETTPEPVQTQQESPEVVKEKPQEKPVEKPVEKPQTEPEKKPEPKRELRKEATYGAKGEGESKDPPAASEGDDKDKTGDKGKQVLAKGSTYEGKPGGGQGGPALSIVGWTWDAVPKAKDNSSENGTVTFEFMIDEDGYVFFTKTIKSSVSPSVAKFYEDQLKQTTFSRTGTGAVQPGNTKGTVTFTIVSK